MKHPSRRDHRRRKQPLLLNSARKKSEPPSSFLYGPVPSRRLGFSLGVDIIPYKTCSFDCVYCQLGRTPQKSLLRKRFFPSRKILAQTEKALRSGQRIDHITFSGSGEPTLNAQLGSLIRQVKKMTSIPVAVLTNSSLLRLKSVRRALCAADIVVPSLDAATAAGFQKVNRPEPSVSLEKVIESLAQFRREYKGQIWLEVMLVKGVNDSPAEITALHKAIATIKPDKIQLNTVVRPPAETWARPLSPRSLERIRGQLGDRAEVVVDFKRKRQRRSASDLRQAILSLLKRRPVTEDDIAATLGHSRREINGHLKSLLRWGRIASRSHKGIIYYESPGAGR